MKLGNYLTSLNGANAGLGGYIKSLGIAKLKTIALSIATTALNMVIGAIASAIASFIIKGISNIINSAENMKKAVDDMVTSYNDSLKTLESHKKTINDIKDDYETLSKGVDELGNNVSLTTDEYKKYQDICNQIADIYPSLIAGHTSEGNAILTLKGNVEALTKAYKDEQKAAAASVISGSDKENTNVVKNYKNESKTGIKSAFKSAFTFNSDKSMVNGLSTTQKISYLERATNLSINELKNKSGSIGSDNVFRSLLKTYGLDTDSTDQEVTTIIQNMKADLSTYQAEVDEAMKGIKTKANAYFIYNSDYDNLNDEQINQISSLIDKALTEEIADTFNKDSDINSKFVQKIIDGIENNKEGISNAYKSLLTIDPNNMGDVSKDKQAIDGYIKKIADYIGTDAESLKKGLGYDVADDISQQYNNIIEEATKKSKEEAIKDAEKNLQDEYDKISSSEFNLGKYKDQIKNGTLPSQYGNVDMDNRQIIDWNIENIEKWKDALQDIQYYDDDGNFIDSYYDQLKESVENGYSSIDTVFGDMMDHIEGYGDITALAFSHIVNNDDGTFEFLGQKTAEEYLYGILDVAKQDGDMSIDHILELDKNGIQNAQIYNSQGEQIGETYIHGIISGFNDNADDISKLTHFVGKYGAIQIAQDAIEEAKKKEPDFDWDNWFKEHSVNTQEEIDKWKEIASSANSAAEAREKYAKQADTFKETKLFDMGSDSAPSTLSKLNSQLDEIQSAYSTLSSAVSEYNSNGNMSIDTMQSIIALGDNWLDYIDMESGAFTLDQEALDKLTQARIEDMKQQALANLASTVESITTEADATKYLASTNYDAANSYQELAKAKLSEVQGNLQKKVEEGSLSQDSYDKIISKFESDANKISQIFDNTSFKLTADDSIGDSLSELESHANLLKSIQDELQNTSRLSSSTLDSIAKAFPELNESVKQFRNGLLSSEELFALLEQAYNDDADAYISNQIKKSQYDGTYYDNLVSANNEFFQGLFDAYGEDLEKSKNLAQAKKVINDKVISLLASSWGKFYQTEIDNATGLMKIASKATSMDDDMDLGLAIAQSGGNEEEYFSDFLSTLQKTVDDYNALQNIAIDTTWGGIDTSWKGLSGYDSSSKDTKETAEKLNWIERLINKISTAYSHLKNVVSDTTTTWLNRNNALSDSMSTLADEINAQSDAYEYYMNAFNSYGLDDYYKNQIADGSISIDVIYDDDLKDAISDCQDFYDKAQDCKDAVESLSQEYRELAMTKFNNIKSQFEEQISLIENTTSELQKMQDILSTQGYTNSKFLYGSLIKTEKENLEKLNAEYTALASKIGTVEEGSENWYSMQADINSVSEAILDATNSLREYENELRKIEWDAFDRGRDDVADLIDETEFLYNLLENKGLYDDSGNLNEYGQAAQAMTAQKYQLYASQAKAYADEINKINEELAKDPYNTTLIDRKQELIKLQQESIKSALDEKNAIKDLISNGFEEYTKSLNEIIDKYKDMMSTIKDAYDYEKSIAEQTKNIALLEKQYIAYQGDDSEGSKKTIQEIKANLESAKDDLKETEYEKLISDTEKLLDDLQDSTEEWLNQRLDDLDALIENVINQSNENAGSVSETIANVAKETGYTLSDNMNSIWSTYSGNLVNALGNASDVFTNNQSKLQSVVENIGDKVQKLLDYADAEAARLQAEQEAREEAAREEAARQEAADTDNSWSGSDYDGDSGDSSSGGSGGVDWIYSPDYYPKDQLNIETSIVDRLKWHDWDSSFSARSQYYDQMGGDGNYYATYDQNVWMLDWMKANGFAKGSRNIPKNQIALTQEKGQELIFSKLKGTMLTPLGKGDMVFTKEMSENLWKLAQNPIAPNMSVPDVKNVVNRNLSNNVKVEFGDVAVTLPNVQNYQDFCRQAQKDPKFEKMVQNMALGQAFGKNGFDKYVY